MSMERTDYVGIGVVLEWDDVKDVMNANNGSRYDELVNYDITVCRPGILGAGEETVVAMIPFFNPVEAGRDGFIQPMKLDIEEVDILMMQDNVRNWCFQNFGLAVHASPMVFSVWR